MNNEFILSFEDKTLSNLTGNQYGRTIFKKQVADNISYDCKITIVFPKYISNIGSSFVQGFFDEMVGQIGIKGIEDMVEIKSDAIDDIKQYILKRLRF